MAIYCIILVYLLFLIYRFDIKKDLNLKKKKHHYIVLMILMIMVAGFSYRLGTDCINYEYSFYHMPQNIKDWQNWRDSNEIGWFLINYLSSKVIYNFSCVKIITAIFVNGTIFWFVKKYSTNWFVVIFLYYTMQYMNINFEVLRESIAISIILIGIDKLLCGKRPWTSYILAVIIAQTFHHFAFVALVIPLFKYLKVNKTSIIIILIAFVVSGTIGSVIGENLRYFSLLAGYEDVVYMYLNDDLYGNAFHNFNGLLVIVIQNIIMVTLISFNKESSKLVIGCAIGYSLITFLSLTVFILMRLNNYLFFFLIIAMADSITILPNKLHLKRHIKILLLFCFIAISSKGLYKEDVIIRYVPYVSIFDPYTIPQREQLYLH